MESRLYLVIWIAPLLGMTWTIETQMLNQLVLKKTYSNLHYMKSRIISLKFVPTILEWGESVIVSGTDGFVLFYDKEGRLIKQFDYTRQDDVEEFSTSVLNPGGNTVVLGGFDKLYMYDYSSSKLTWVEVPPIKIAGLYCTSALAWKPDGSRLVVSNMCGAVEILEYCLRKSSLNGKFELNYISPSRIQVKRLTDNRKADVQCQFGYDLEDVKILEDQFLVARTCETLIIADVETAKVSEVC